MVLSLLFLVFCSVCFVWSAVFCCFWYTIEKSAYINFTFVCMPGVCIYVHLLKNGIKKKKKKKVKTMYVFFHHSENVSIAVTRIFCRAPPVSAGDPATLTCHYPQNLSQSRKSICVLRRDSIPGSRDGECLSRLSPRGNLTYRATPHPPPHPSLQYAAKLVLKCSLE